MHTKEISHDDGMHMDQAWHQINSLLVFGFCVYRMY